MATPVPPVDSRKATDITQQVYKLLANHAPKWSQHIDLVTGKPTTDDPLGKALIGIFSRFAEIIIQRLNQAPEKNFLAFLDLLGASQRPPLPARVPLTFSLAAGSLGDVIVPAGTQVAASAAEGETTPVLFETEADLVLTAAQLKAVFVRDPDGDKYANCTDQATGIKDESFNPFEGTLPSEHSLYLACDELFTLPAPKTLTITISLKSGSTWPAVTWNYSDGKEWKPLTDSPTNQNPVSFSNPPAFIKTTINSIEAAWLKAQLKSPPWDMLPTIEAINVTANRKNLLPDLGFVNTHPLDLTKDFYPFGENPQLNDTFYLASQEIFSKAGASVTMIVTLNPVAPIKKDGGIVVVWEAWNGTEWQSLSNDFAFTKSEQDIKFVLPKPMGPREENGATSYWIRARITQGNYGAGSSTQPSIFTTLSEESKVGNSLTIKLARGIMPGDDIYIPAKGAVNEFHTTVQSISFKESTLVLTLKDALENTQLYPKNTGVWIYPKVDLAPPLVESLQLTYEVSRPLSACKSCNDLTFQDWENFGEPFQPFKLSTDDKPTLYLGFDQPFTRNRSINLYVHAEPPLYQQPSADAVEQPSPIKSGQDQKTEQPPARLIWEYSAGQDKSPKDAWKKLVVQDGAQSFTKRGLIAFMAPSDFQPCQQFGQALYWLRVRHEAGTFSHPPQVRRLLTNTTWAKQAITITNEVLGSGNGGKNQRFQTTQTPVLTGQQLQVQELEEPSAAEHDQILKEEGKDAIRIQYDATGRPQEIWVRWHEVPDFYGSGPRDRHYVINHMTGELKFGDGVNGLIPPIGKGNVCMARYQTGGGKAGNKPVGSLVQLKTTIPYVESVMNWEAAGGGANADSLDDVKELMPRSIRHGNRAVTVEDFEDLARLASPAVARAKCVPLYDLHNDSGIRNKKPGAVSLIIVPRTADDRPAPSQELLDQVERYLSGHRIPTAELVVVGPDYVQVDVKAEIALVSLEKAGSVEREIRQALDRFLHPLTGGSDGNGWDFGRKPYLSDLYALLQAIPGVDHICCLTVAPTAVPPTGLVCSGKDHSITLTLAET